MCAHSFRSLDSATTATHSHRPTAAAVLAVHAAVELVLALAELALPDRPVAAADGGVAVGAAVAVHARLIYLRPPSQSGICPAWKSVRR